jgi:hypothetical protein
MSLVDGAFQVPEALKEQVAHRLKATGALRQITRSVKVAMTAAIAELRGLRPDAKSVLEFKRMADASQEDLAALQAIYRFLDESGMTFTLARLMEESGVEKDVSDIDLMELFAQD